MWYGIVSLFPELFSALKFGVVGRALDSGIIKTEYWNPRDFAEDNYKIVDDKPYGGGPGMVMMAPPLIKTIQAAKKAAPFPPTVVYVSPQGKIFDQQAAQYLSKKESIIFVSGRYEGIDERVFSEIDEEWSIGDYVLSGGEIPILAMIDAISRLIPGVVKEVDSIQQDSITTGLLKYPQYTRPPVYDQQAVPDILLSGDHEDIAAWRLLESLLKTETKRPDLLKKREISESEQQLLRKFLKKIAS